jgi:cytochrome c oxidase subunit I+III
MTDWKKLLLRAATTTDHKDIGKLYLFTSGLFGLFGLTLAIVMRLQLFTAENDLVEVDTYYRTVTSHGLIMLLFFASPLAFAFANYFVPLQLGQKDMAFPRINAMSYWLYLFGGLVIALGYLTGYMAETGWTFYVPLSDKHFSPDEGVEIAGVGLVMVTL